jgi:trehalose-6-phosphate synthase
MKEKCLRKKIAVGVNRPTDVAGLRNSTTEFCEFAEEEISLSTKVHALYTLPLMNQTLLLFSAKV